MHTDRIIAVETSSRQGSVAVAVGPSILAEARFAADAEHARDLLPLADRLCIECGWSPADINQCFLSIGPGSFTGLRVAVTFARHLALGVGARLVAVPTLHVIAENCRTMSDAPHYLAVLLDAKRGQVFGQTFELRADRYEPRSNAAMIEPAALLANAPRPIAVVGEGIGHHRKAVEAAGAQIVDPLSWPPRVANLHRVGLRLAAESCFTEPTRLVPLYLRRPEAEELWEARRHAGEGHR